MVEGGFLKAGGRGHALLCITKLKVVQIIPKRSPAVPDTPTVAESLPGYEVNQWYGFITGAKVPPAIVKKFNDGIVAALKAPDVNQRLLNDGSVPVGSTPEQFNAHIKSEIAKWNKLIKELGVKSE